MLDMFDKYDNEKSINWQNRKQVNEVDKNLLSVAKDDKSLRS